MKRSGLHRNVWVTSATSFLTDVSSEMVLNVLPLFLANVLGVRVWAVGLVEGLADTTASLLKLYAGWISDRLGARKWLAVGGYAVSAGAKPFYLLASGWGHVAGIRWADRVGKGIRTAPRDALLADSAPAHRRGLAFGLHRAADSAGAVLGLGITIWLVRRVQGGGDLLAEETFRTLVWWSLVPAALGVLTLAAGARDVALPAAPERPRTAPPRPALRGLGPGFAAFVACSVLFELGNSADAFLVLRAQERGLSLTSILWVLLAFNVVYAAVATPAGALADRIPRRALVAGSWLLYAVAYVGFALARSGTDVVLLYLLYGAYHGIGAGAAKALVADLVPAELRGTAYGTYAAATGVLALPASVLAGVLWEGVGSWGGLGPSAPFYFGATTAVIAAAALLLSVRGPEAGAPSGTPEERRGASDSADATAPESMQATSTDATAAARTSTPASSVAASSAPTAVPVVAAVVRRANRFLVAQRPLTKRHGGLWEFPGGKVRPEESVRDAVTRELYEELALEVTGVGALLYSRQDDGAPFVIDFLEVDARGEPQEHEHDAVGWFDLSELTDLPLAPADRAFVAWLSERGGAPRT